MVDRHGDPGVITPLTCTLCPGAGGRRQWAGSTTPRLNTKGLMDHIWPGHAYPLGATFDGSGVNFALFSEVADKVLANPVIESYRVEVE